MIRAEPIDVELVKAAVAALDDLGACENPDCLVCVQALPRLRAWLESLPNDAPEMAEAFARSL